MLGFALVRSPRGASGAETESEALITTSLTPAGY